jgi:hypothetical protein
METPECPDPSHAGSKRVRAGWQGQGKFRRQRWWCVPPSGEPRHRFVGLLPRLAADGCACLECETVLEKWEGPQLPRLYGFTTRQVAKTLVRVAGGWAYRSAADLVRVEAGRPLADGPVTKGKRHFGRNCHGQLVADWVEVFGPVIAAAYAPTEWPERLVLDSDEYRKGGSGRRGSRLFVVLGAVGYRGESRKAEVLRLEVNHVENSGLWWDFLRCLEGAPDLLVCDAGPAILGPARRHFGDATTIRRCEWHLGRNLREGLDARVLADPEHPVMVALLEAQRSPADWDKFVSAVEATDGMLRTRRWLATNSEMVRAQAATSADVFPRSNGAVEKVLRDVSHRIGDRATSFTNKRRTDALLSLFATEMNGHADELAWADLIRQHLEANSGRGNDQRLLKDPEKARTLQPNWTRKPKGTAVISAKTPAVVPVRVKAGSLSGSQPDPFAPEAPDPF